MSGWLRGSGRPRGPVGLQPRWHPDVRDDHVGLQRHRRRLHRVRVADRGHHLVPGVGEQPHQPLPEQHRVLADDEAHHSIAVTVVPRPAATRW